MTTVIILLLPLAFEFNPPGGMASAVPSGAALALPGHALAGNPALLGPLVTSSVIISYIRPHSLPDVHYDRVDVALKGITAGAAATFLGAPGYQEFTLTLAKSQRVVEHLHLGAGAALYVLNLIEERTDVAAGLCAGAAWHYRWFAAGGAIHNFNRPTLGTGERLPLRALFGVTAQPVPPVTLGADCEYRADWRYRFGALYEVHPALSLGLGMGLNPLSYSGGLRCGWRGFGLYYTGLFHPRLKQSHVLGLGYSF